MIVDDIVYALFVFFALSLVLIKENKFSRIAETTFVAASVANLGVMAVKGIVNTSITPLVQGKYLSLIPILLGSLLFLRLVKSSKYRRISMWSLALLIGVGTGLSMRGAIETNVAKQLEATILPITGASAFNNIVIIVGVFATLFVFVFTFFTGDKTLQRTEPIRRVGRYFIIVMLGALFGNTVMNRLATLVGVFQSLLLMIGIS